MNDTRKITIVSLGALLLGFVGLYIYIELFEFTQFTTELDNNSNDFLSTEKRISIFGGSSSIVLNTTHIEENISSEGFNQFHIYNFGWVADTPTKRILKLDKLINVEPELVLYGIGFQHMGYLSLLNPPKCLNDTAAFEDTFSITETESSREDNTLTFLPNEIKALPSVKDIGPFFENFFPFNSEKFSDFENPKHVTVNILKTFFEENNNFNKNTRIIPNFIDPKLFDIVSLIQFSEINSLEEMNKPVPYITRACPEDLNREMESLNYIASKLKENNIEFVIYVPPYTQGFLDTIGEQEINKFLSLLEEFSLENNIKFYSLHDKYVELEIFNNWSHVAIHPNSIIFSDDISEIILNHLGATKLRKVETTNNDLSFMDLSYADLRYVDLSYKNLTGTNLHHSNLFGANLNGTILNNSNLSYAYLKELNLSNKDLSGTNLVGANLAGANLNSVILSGKDLSTSDLSKVNLSLKDLTGTILTGAKLDFANLDGVDLTGKDLTGTSLVGVNLSGKDLTGTILVGADLNTANLDGVDLSGKDLSGTSMRWVNLSGKDFTGTNLASTSLAGATLLGVDLSGKDLTNAELHFANLVGANLSGVDLSGHDLTRTILINNDLSKTNLSETILTRAQLDFANLEGVDLSGKDLSGTSLKGVDLSGKDFTGSYLHLADFSFANLTGANLSDIESPNANFTSADLSYANLSNSYLINSDFSNANLQNTILTDADLLGAVLSCYNNPICK